MKTILTTGNISKVKTGNPKTIMTTGLRSKINGSNKVITATPGDRIFDYTFDATFE